VHFTPPLELHEGPHGGRRYPYSNKPGGLRHWLAHASPPVESGGVSFVCLVDPDMLLLRPISPLIKEGLVPSPRRGKAQSSKLQFELSELLPSPTTAQSRDSQGHSPPLGDPSSSASAPLASSSASPSSSSSSLSSPPSSSSSAARGGKAVGRVLGVAVDELRDRVERGRPAGQHFGIGGVWARAGTANAGKAWRSFSKAAVCGEGAPCTTT